MSWKPGLCHKIRPCSSIVLVNFCDCPQEIWIMISAKKGPIQSCSVLPSQSFWSVQVHVSSKRCQPSVPTHWRNLDGKKHNLINLSWICIWLAYQAWTPMLCSWHELCNPELFWKDGPKVWEVVSSKNWSEMSNSCKPKEMQEVLQILSHNFQFAAFTCFRVRNSCQIPQFFGALRLSILPKHLLWIRSFLPCWVSMGHRLGNFRKAGTPNQPRNSLNNWVGDQEIHGRWSKPGNLLFQQKMGSYRKISWANHWTHIFRYIF